MNNEKNKWFSEMNPKNRQGLVTLLVIVCAIVVVSAGIQIGKIVA